MEDSIKWKGQNYYYVTEKIELTDSNKNVRVDSKKGSKFKDDTASNMSDSI